ncbi:MULTISPECIES: PRC-barrel domain-containing protein [unclassified Coleofasciculus]|uniref:PRC-barrel domain-containing protein n=1 Tax=unclassified Coleofasciculus TaxID=2692782 RepID=UPI00188130EC|nr:MULTISPECIES: PRC-barrel domain-containing protein [unclassified Coleofasciculus]MBE9128927.1 PRC-barrel domain-containing protein [Coleofasciculus sp. LEGE 07081]MBE9150395.1 PRC-barrel domain-containing protein [Coleofasciculus sp. LEGE 07092]
MSVQPQILKQSELLNRLVLDRHTTEEVGRVAQLWLDPQAHRVVGFTCKSGLLGGKKQSFTWRQIYTIGTDSILVSTLQDTTVSDQGEPLESRIGHEVWTDAGNKVGKLVDYIFEPKSGAVINYLYASNGWGVMDGIYLLAPAAISSVGSKRLIVLTAAVQNSQKYTEGVNERISQAAEFIREDYQKTLKHMETVKQDMPHFAENLKDQAQSATDKIKERFSEVKMPFHKESQSDSKGSDKTSD